jgi:putative membrane protein
MMGWGGTLAGILLILFLAGVVIVVIGLGVWTLVRYGQRQGDRGTGAGGRALDILKERYARGELTREEYEERRRDLEA